MSPFDLHRCPRREFLTAAAALPAAVLAARLAVADQPGGEQKMPMIRIGKHQLSRLVCGNNPFGAGSHLSTFVNQEMRRYYTPEQILETLGRCQAAGVNAWQSTVQYLDLYHRYLDGGGKMLFLTI